MFERLRKHRSRLYRDQFLQVSTCFRYVQDKFDQMCILLNRYNLRNNLANFVKCLVSVHELFAIFVIVRQIRQVFSLLF